MSDTMMTTTTKGKERQQQQQEGNDRKGMSPKSGGRGLRDKTKPRDKNVRITSELYNEMMKAATKMALKKKEYETTDFYDICSAVWELWKLHPELHHEVEKKDEEEEGT
jgi:excinuclease UvrABC helicase subunit UvrB